jgi:hypothetical protein
VTRRQQLAERAARPKDVGDRARVALTHALDGTVQKLQVSRVAEQRVALGTLELGEPRNIVPRRRDVHSVEHLEVVGDEAEHHLGALRVGYLLECAGWAAVHAGRLRWCWARWSPGC